jgi:hypothetical protein
MNPIFSWGLSVVRVMQSFANPALTLVMQGITLAGSRLGYLAFIPFIYWCVDKRQGLRVGMAGETAVDHAFGFPSGHAQTSALLGGSLRRFFKKPWTRLIPLAYPLMVGVSRIYFGVHFPTDILAGWAIGAAIVCLERLVGDRIERALAGLRKIFILAAVAAASLLVFALSTEEPSLAGVFFGFAGTAIYAKKLAPFSVTGSFGKRALRFLLGMAAVIMIFVLPNVLTSGIEAAAPSLFSFSHYALLGAWVSFGAPWLFLKIGLAEREPLSANEKATTPIAA